MGNFRGDPSKKELEKMDETQRQEYAHYLEKKKREQKAAENGLRRLIEFSQEEERRDWTFLRNCLLAILGLILLVFIFWIIAGGW